MIGNKYRIAPAGHGRALHSLIGQYIEACHRNLLFIEQHGLLPYMDLRRKYTGYHAKEDIFFLENPWNNYFIQEELGENELFFSEICHQATDFALPGGQVPRAHYHNYTNITEKFLKIQPNILYKVDEFIKKYFVGKVVAIHIRGTDSFFDKTRPHLPVGYYITLIKEKLQDYEKILICTDSFEILEILKNTLGNKIISYDSERSTLEKYDQQLSYVASDPYKAGENVLIESLLMARCDLLIKGFSNIGFFSLAMNPNIKIHQIDYKFFLPEHTNRAIHENFVNDYYIKSLEITDMDYYLEKSKKFEYEKFKLVDAHDTVSLKNLILQYFYSY